MYKEFQFYDGNVFNIEAVKTFLDAEIVEEDFNLMYMNAFEKCSQLGKVLKKNIEICINFILFLDKSTINETFHFVELDNVFNCDVYPQYMDICVWYHTLANCPESYYSNDDVCNSKSEWVNECLLK